MNIIQPLPILVTWITLFLFSCSSLQKETLWVNSIKSTCDAGAGKMQCLSIYRGDVIDEADWELFYAGIEGFDFEPGYFQRIEISSETMDQSEVPADGSSIKYVLLNTLEKKSDSRYLLHDIWVLERINGRPVGGVEILPRMEINLSSMKVHGNNGCNDYTGKVESVTSAEIRFGVIATTRKMCNDMSIPDSYDHAMNTTTAYKHEGTELIFFDKESNETLHFKKID